MKTFVVRCTFHCWIISVIWQCSVTACRAVISFLIVDLFTNESFVYNKKLSNTCEEFQFRGWYDAAFRLGQETNQILSSRLWARWSTSLLEFEKYLMSLLAKTKRRVIPATKVKFFTRIVCNKLKSVIHYFVHFQSYSLFTVEILFDIHHVS